MCGCVGLLIWCLDRFVCYCLFECVMVCGGLYLRVLLYSYVVLVAGLVGCLEFAIAWGWLGRIVLLEAGVRLWLIYCCMMLVVVF